MITTGLILGLLEAGAAVAASEVVKDTTKDAYTKMRDTIARHFGAKVTVSEGKADLLSSSAGRGLLPAQRALSDADAAAIGPEAEALIRALRADPAAAEAMRQAQIDFDLEAQGNILIGEIKNARSIRLKAKSAKDIRVGPLAMEKDKKGGK